MIKKRASTETGAGQKEQPVSDHSPLDNIDDLHRQDRLSPVTNKFTVSKSIEAFLLWLLHIIKFVVQTHRRFLVISPPVFHTQLIFDYRNKSLFSIKIRGLVDWYTTLKIFFDNEYGFERLARHSEFEKYYEKLISDGVTPFILDCGGNIGLAAKFLLRHIRERIFVLSNQGMTMFRRRGLTTIPIG